MWFVTHAGAITITNENNMWFGTETGLYCYKNEEFTHYTTKDGLSGNNILDITQDAVQNLWLATESNGISIFDGKNFTNFTTKNSALGKMDYPPKYAILLLSTKIIT